MDPALWNQDTKDQDMGPYPTMKKFLANEATTTDETEPTSTSDTTSKKPQTYSTEWQKLECNTTLDINSVKSVIGNLQTSIDSVYSSKQVISKKESNWDHN